VLELQQLIARDNLIALSKLMLDNVRHLKLGLNFDSEKNRKFHEDINDEYRQLQIEFQILSDIIKNYETEGIQHDV
jgi:hypothetical protein